MPDRRAGERPKRVTVPSERLHGAQGQCGAIEPGAFDQRGHGEFGDSYEVMLDLLGDDLNGSFADTPAILPDAGNRTICLL